MDIRDRIMGDKPHDFLHKIAGIVPGYDGYMDRERRRDADKMLRMQLARQYLAQRERLTRVQQSLLSAHKLELIAQVDREVGALQRFIDRLSTATYGYSGLFDPVKVEAADLDQLYAFDMSLASGVEQVSSAIDPIESATSSGGGGTSALQDLPAAIGRLATTLDSLNQRLNQRADLLTSGQRLPENEYRGMVSNLTQPPATPQAGEMVRYPGGTGDEGTPTTALSKTSATMGAAGGSAEGIQTASSPMDQPGPTGHQHDVVEGLDMTSGPGTPAPQVDVPDTLKPLGDEGHG